MAVYIMMVNGSYKDKRDAPGYMDQSMTCFVALADRLRELQELQGFTLMKAARSENFARESKLMGHEESWNTMREGRNVLANKIHVSDEKFRACDTHTFRLVIGMSF